MQDPIVLVNRSLSIPAAVVTAFVQPLQTFLNALCAAWGLVPWRVVFDPPSIGQDGLPLDEALKSYARRLVIQEDPDVPNAGGYHEQDGRGRPVGKVFASVYARAMSTDPSSPTADTLLTAAAHELGEMRVDEPASLWAMMPNGVLTALESCDACESVPVWASADGLLMAAPPQSPGPGAWVSDFLFPSWFREHGAAPYDFAGRCAAPFAMTGAGDYMIECGEDRRGPHDVFGSTLLHAPALPNGRIVGATLKALRKAEHAGSRAHRRLYGTRLSP